MKLRAKRLGLAATTAVIAAASLAMVAGSSAGAASKLKSGQTIYFIPKDTLNPYEVIADNGGKTALALRFAIRDGFPLRSVELLKMRQRGQAPATILKRPPRGH